MCGCSQIRQNGGCNTELLCEMSRQWLLRATGCSAETKLEQNRSTEVVRLTGHGFKKKPGLSPLRQNNIFYESFYICMCAEGDTAD